MRTLLRKKFGIADFLDDCRWDAGASGNYYLASYSHEEMSDNLRLLTHWICYITDRQTSFEQIWDIGGLVFSDMLKYYKDHNIGINVLLIDNPESFFKRKPGRDYVFESKAVMPRNDIAVKYDRPVGEPVTFKSRYYPSDYLSILYTLCTLEKYERDLIHAKTWCTASCTGFMP